MPADSGIGRGKVLSIDTCPIARSYVGRSSVGRKSEAYPATFAEKDLLDVISIQAWIAIEHKFEGRRMSIYKRDGVFPEWEPAPWDLSGRTADAQERGFHERATKVVVWQKVPFLSFPAEGIFGCGLRWFRSNDIMFYASCEGEDLILIQNTYSGWPDPPEWGLASRPSGQYDVKWEMWGYVPRLPEMWKMP